MRISAGVQTCALPIYWSFYPGLLAAGGPSLQRSRYARGLRDRALGVQFGGHVRASDHLNTDRSGLQRCQQVAPRFLAGAHHRSEEHTSELQSLMRISYAVFCLKKKNQTQLSTHNIIDTQMQQHEP